MSLWFGGPHPFEGPAGWICDPSTALPAPASPYRGDGHGGGGASGAKHLVVGVGGRTVGVGGAGGHLAALEEVDR